MKLISKNIPSKKIKIVETQKKLNPYITGMPLHSSEMFYGRERVLAKIASSFLPSSENNIFALCGQRRIGKTSVLYQLRNRLLNPEYCVGVVIDLSMYGKIRDDDLLDTIAYGIDLELYPKHVLDSSLRFTQGRPLQKFKKQPFLAFDAFLKSVRNAIGGRKLVLLFDEVEWLFFSIEAGILKASFLENFLRMIIEREDIVLVFAGKESFTALLSTFGLSAPKAAIEVIKIGHLSKETTLKLITEPCSFYLSYDDKALEMMFRQTDGHPYLTQCLCYHLVKEKNSSLSCGRRRGAHRTLGAGKPQAGTPAQAKVKKSDVEAVKHDFMRSVEGYFEDLFYDWTMAEKLWMSAVASLSHNEDEWVSEDKMFASLTNFGLRLEHLSFYDTEEQLKTAASSLVDAELLTKDGQFYKSRIGIFTEWLAKYHPLEETVGKKL